MAFVESGENYKNAHHNESCLLAAAQGVGSAQYSVGMAFGFEGFRDTEEKFYRLAADNGVIAAYLALGHVLSEKRPWEAIYWYQRYFSTGIDGHGFAALRLAHVFEQLGDSNQVAYWLDACRSSDYSHGCDTPAGETGPQP